MNAPARPRAPSVTQARFEELLAASPAGPPMGGAYRVVHCLAKPAGDRLPACVRRHLKNAIRGSEGPVTWTLLRDNEAWARSTLVIKHGPCDRDLTRFFGLCIAQGWLTRESWERMLVGRPLRRVETGHGLPSGAEWVYETDSSTRSEVIRGGTLLYTQARHGGHFEGWVWANGRSRREHLDVRDLNYVALAEPDPIAAPRPARFVVDAVTWCGWERGARDALRLVADWTKGPGVMGTAALDGVTSERVRDVAVQWGLIGLEESEGSAHG